MKVLYVDVQRLYTDANRTSMNMTYVAQAVLASESNASTTDSDINIRTRQNMVQIFALKPAAKIALSAQCATIFSFKIVNPGTRQFPGTSQVSISSIGDVPITPAYLSTMVGRALGQNSFTLAQIQTSSNIRGAPAILTFTFAIDAPLIPGQNVTFHGLHDIAWPESSARLSITQRAYVPIQNNLTSSAQGANQDVAGQLFDAGNDASLKTVDDVLSVYAVWRRENATLTVTVNKACAANTVVQVAFDIMNPQSNASRRVLYATAGTDGGIQEGDASLGGGPVDQYVHIAQTEMVGGKDVLRSDEDCAWDVAEVRESQR
jgi:hypothetical protein